MDKKRMKHVKRTQYSKVGVLTTLLLQFAWLVVAFIVQALNSTILVQILELVAWP